VTPCAPVEPSESLCCGFSDGVVGGEHSLRLSSAPSAASSCQSGSCRGDGEPSEHIPPTETSTDSVSVSHWQPVQGFAVASPQQNIAGNAAEIIATLLSQGADLSDPERCRFGVFLAVGSPSNNLHFSFAHLSRFTLWDTEKQRVVAGCVDVSVGACSAGPLCDVCVRP
jgi:hypothetical protein